jgi:DNA modification methylase
MPLASGKIHQGDCIKLMQKIDAGTVDLVFADPPFNIGYEYDQYDDRQEDQKYLDWCTDWIREVHRILKPTGTFWLAIGDEYAAELKVAAQREIGFTTRSWVIWYYTFGVNCKNKFSRSHAHLFHFVKDEKNFTFNADDSEIRVPSARALVYGDKRANPKGRLPDDTWILRPQDFQSDRYGFTPDQDTWFFSRVAGTFKERQGFHGCQMPEQLLARIIRASSNEGDVVFDPFTGSGTTLAVAKKLGRQFLGTELSTEYARAATERLKKIKVGDALDGPADPVASAPSTANGVRLGADGSRVSSNPTNICFEKRSSPKADKASIHKGIQEAFLATHEGFSSDRLLADPHLNESFIQRCRSLGIPGDTANLNRILIGLRKAGKLKTKFTPRNVTISNAEFDLYSFAAEIAWKLVRVKFSDVSLDEILCDPVKALLFDELAKDFSPGFKPVEYRWAALRIRKRRKSDLRKATAISSMLAAERFRPSVALGDLDFDSIGTIPGLYLLKDEMKKDIYLGETLNLRGRLESHLKRWRHAESPQHISLLPKSELLEESKFHLVGKRTPILNVNLTVVKS